MICQDIVIRAGLQRPRLQPAQHVVAVPHVLAAGGVAVVYLGDPVILVIGQVGLVLRRAKLLQKL